MRNLILLIVCLNLMGCATGYKKVGFKGGYDDFKLQDDIFKVSFRGNSYVSNSRVEDFALLRCAEVTLENGYKYFVIIDEKMSIKTHLGTTPTTAHTTPDGTTYFSGGEVYSYNKPSTRNTIKCFTEKPEDILAIVYDAEQVKTNIKTKYSLK